MKLVSTTDIAKKWNITRRRVTALCAQGRIDGAVMVGNTWLVPEDAKKPEDARKSPDNGTSESVY